MRSSFASVRRGFTLIELLVVIAIIAILAAILFPVFAQAREKARGAACLSNEKQIMTAVKMYTQDYDEISPYWLWSQNTPGVYTYWMEAVNPYVKNTQIWICPSAPKDAASYGVTNGTKLVSTYCWPGFIPFTYYNWFNGKAEFAGFPAPCGNLASDSTVCPNSTNIAVCGPGAGAKAYSACISSELTYAPAESAFLVEGYATAYYPYQNLQFGSASNVGFDFNKDNNAINRHQQGLNIGFCDGHAKYKRADSFYFDASATTTGGYAGYPEDTYLKVGF